MATLVSRVVGVPTNGVGRVAVRTTSATSVRLKVGTNSTVSSGVIFGPAVTPNAQGDSQLTVSGLANATQYYYRIEMTDSGGGGVQLDTGTVGKFKTAPAPNTAASFAFNFGSCATSDTPSMSAAAARNDDLFFHLGDFYYHDGSGTSLSNFRTRMSARIQTSNHQQLLSTTPFCYTPSDDGMNNDGAYGSDPTAWTNWNQSYREMFPTPPLQGTMGCHFAFTWGRIRFIQIDTRSFKSSPSATDNSSKTSLGATQKQWLKNEITNATEPVIIILQDNPWISSAKSGDDAWAGYTTERTELATFFRNSGKNIGMLAGDMHALAADDGTNAPGGIFVFHAAPLSTSSSIKGGPYTEGTYPTSAGQSVQQYGRVVVTDTGSQISLAFTGYSATNTARLSLTKTFATTPPGPAVPAVPTGLTATPANDSQINVAWNSVSNATGYDLEIDGVVVDKATSLTHAHTGLDPSTQYTYRVRARNALGNSAWSAQASASTYAEGQSGPALPSVPTVVAATSLSGSTSATLTWEPPANNGGAAITGYLVGRDGTDSTGQGAWSTTDPATATSRIFNQLVTGQTYNLSVAAINSVGTGPAATVAIVAGSGSGSGSGGGGGTGGGATGTVSLKGIGTALNTAATTNFVLSTHSSTAVGDLLVAAMSIDANTSVLTITPPAGWTAAFTPIQEGSSMTYAVYWRAAASAGVTNHTFTMSAAYKGSGNIAVFSGADTTAPFAGSVTANGLDNVSLSLPTPSADNCLVIGGFAGNHSGGTYTYTTPSGWTRDWAITGQQLCTFYHQDTRQTTAAAASFTAPINTVNNIQWTGWIAAIKPLVVAGVVIDRWDGSALVRQRIDYRGNSGLEQFILKATGGGGSGLTVPTAPTSVSGSPGINNATLSWQAPSSNGGSAITGYWVGRDGTDSKGQGPWSTTDPETATSRVFNDLVDGQTYNLSVAAFNTIGTGPTVTVPVTLGTGGGTGEPNPTSGGYVMAAPTGNLPGWTLLMSQDFNIDAPTGQFGAAYGSNWTMYDGWEDTSRELGRAVGKRGVYNTSKVVSVHDSMLDMHVRYENGQYLVAAPTPMGWTGQTYGRYAYRFRATVTGQGYKTAWLLWPLSDDWNEGEIDFPEGDLDGVIKGYSHDTGGSPTVNRFSVDSGKTYDAWHVAVIEWIPGRLSYFLDGQLLGTTTDSRAIPTTDFRWVLQTETWLEVTPPPEATSGHVYVDWVAAWSYTP